MKTILCLMLVSLVGCAEYCPLGEPCERSCPAGTSGLCGPAELCLCAPENGVSHSDPAPCREPAPGELYISEVMIDGEPTEDHEFIEMVNSAAVPVDLSGVAVLSTRGTRLVRRVLFLSGCMAPYSAVGMFTDEDNWVWSDVPEGGAVADIGTFGFSNRADFSFAIDGASGERLDSVSGSAEQIRPGISLVRESGSQALELHTVVASGRRRSPGRCSNGGIFRDGCVPDSEESAQCGSPEPGQLRINEVLIDGEPSEEDEFIEMINVTDRPLSLRGIEVLSNRGQVLSPRVRFLEGCLPARAVVTMYSDFDRWLMPFRGRDTLEVELERFGFPNSAPFDFRLRDHLGRELDRFQGERSLIRPGVSVTRFPDRFSDVLERHNQVSQFESSPGHCTDGSSFSTSCMPGGDSQSDMISRLLRNLPWELLGRLDWEQQP